jgi:rhodanese-related sulfurtransferase/tRNA A-37 threonylcarbamoyl transferase component Bud32
MVAWPPDAFRLSYMVQCLAMMIPFALHSLSSWAHPGSAHAIIAITFGALIVFRMGLHFSGLKEREARRIWHSLLAFASFACPCATFATGRVVPLTEMDLAFVAFGYVAVNFGLIALPNFPAYVTACLVAAHAAMIPAYDIDDASKRGRVVALLLGAIVFGVVAGHQLTAMSGLFHTSPACLARGSADRPIALTAMCDELAAGTARLVDVREPRETAKGRLRGALLFPLSEMTEGVAPPTAMRPDGTTYYLYCAQGVRVHPALDLLLCQGFQSVALPEGLQHLLRFAEREPARTKGQLLLASDTGGSLRGGSGSDATVTSDDSSREPQTPSTAELNPGLSAVLDQAGSVLRLTDEAYGKYEVQKTLGRGSFGVVSLVCERSSGTLVVCKELSIRGRRPRELRQAATEVALQASLRHPHILPIFGVHEQPGMLRLILQYAPLGSLEERISMYESSGWDFSQSEVSRWAGQAAAALQYMHGQRILHRDLSTSNLLLNEDDDVLITDFGLSCMLKRASDKAFERGTESQSRLGDSRDSELLRTMLAKTMCGTPNYMSPELVEGKGYDRKSDLWSLGVVLFELLTLRCPFSAPSIGGLVAVIVAGKIDACGLKRLEKSDVSAELKRLVSDDGGLLDPTPAKRATLDDVLMCCPYK